MSLNENISGSEPVAAKSKPARSRLHPLHEAAMRLAAMKTAPSRRKTRDLVTLLLSHGARAWRGSQPQATIHLYTTSPSGHRPVRMRIR
jgi:hypothetical protein